MAKRIKNKQARKEKQLLTKLQREALGERPPQHIWKDSLFPLYPEVSEYFIDHSLDEVQSFPTFIEMGKKDPDELGQGRFKIEEARKTIGVMLLVNQKKNEKNLSDCSQMISELFEAYFHPLSVEILRPLELVRSGSTYSVIDEVRKLEFPLKNVKRQKPAILDVFSLFDVLVEYVEPHMYTVLAITDANIGDPEIPDSDILGRACGDRVACITTKANDKASKLSMVEIAQTAIHETMHTMGLDHCVLWRCIMNAICADGEDGDNFIFTCPLDTRKLQEVLKFEYKDRNKKLLAFFEKQKWVKEQKWLESYIEIMDERPEAERPKN